MNSRRGFLAVAVMMAMLAPTVAWAQAKLAVIDMQRVFDDYYKTDAANAELKKLSEEFTSEQEAMVEKLREMQETFEAQREEARSPALSEAERERKRGAAEDLFLELKKEENSVRRTRDQRKKELFEQEKKIRDQLVGEINVVISAYAAENNIALVLDASGLTANGISPVVYHLESLDVTEVVLQRINEPNEEE